MRGPVLARRHAVAGELVRTARSRETRVKSVPQVPLSLPEGTEMRERRFMSSQDESHIYI